MPVLYTMGQIALLLNMPLHRVRYVVETRHIEPTTRAGQLRMFTDADLEQIRSISGPDPLAI